MKAGALTLAAALLLAPRVDAGQVLTYTEEGTRAGRTARSTVTLAVSAEGVRVTAKDAGENGAPRTVVFLYVAKEDAIFPVEPPTAPVISAATIAVVEERARASGHARAPGLLTATPLHTMQVLGAWTCEAWAISRPGQTTTTACLADPKTLGLDETTRRNLRRMDDLFVPFSNAMRLAEGGDAREGLNTRALAGGFPIREFRSKDGVVESDLRLVSVENADLSPDLFRVPRSAAAPAGPAGPAAVPPATHASDRSLRAEVWVRRGMPDVTRPWTAADYETAAAVLDAAAKEDAAKLPRKDSAASGEIFRRLVDPGNLAAVRAGGAPDARAKAGAGILSGVGLVSLVYAGAYRDDAALGGEVVALMSYTLLVSHATVPLADSLLAAPGRHEKAADRAVRVAERARLAEGLAALVSGCLASLATPNGFRPADRWDLARALEVHLPALAPYLPAAVRRELPARLAKTATAETDPVVKASLAHVRAAVAARG